MKQTSSLLRIVASAAILVALGACTASYPGRTVSYQATPLERPAAPPTDSEILNVRIEVFDQGALPEDPNAARGLSTEIRAAEAYFIPVQIKETMQKSGHWGQVRVTPKGGREGEVQVTGKILESDGEILKLEIAVRDAAGVPWFTRKYESVVDEAAYAKASAGGVDAFQDMYNQIANDIAAYKKLLKPEDATSIRQVAELKFGAEFAPATYDSHLKKTGDPAQAQPDGLQRVFSLLSREQRPANRTPVYTVERLPAENDPVVQRVSRIRAREEFLVDTLDQQYDGLARGLRDPYTQWRTSRLKEIGAIREADRVKNEERAKAVAVGVIGVLVGAAIASQGSGGNCYGCTSAGAGVAAAAVAIGVQMAVKASEQAAAETNLRKTALEELGNSLSTDVKPTVVEVEGKTVELKGTIEEKFEAWKAVLKELRESEIGPRPAAPPAVET